jgi:hypothetical protein
VLRSDNGRNGLEESPGPGARLVQEFSTETVLAVRPRGVVLAVHPTFALPEPVRLEHQSKGGAV